MKTQARLPRSNENPVALPGSYLESTFNLLQPSHSPHPQAKEGQAYGHRGIGPWFSWWLPILHPRSKITDQFMERGLWPPSLNIHKQFCQKADIFLDVQLWILREMTSGEDCFFFSFFIIWFIEENCFWGMSLHISAQKQGQKRIPRTTTKTTTGCRSKTKGNVANINTPWRTYTRSHVPTSRQGSQEFRLALVIASNSCHPKPPPGQGIIPWHTMSSFIMNAFSVLPVTESVALVFFYRNTDRITLRPFCMFWVIGQNSKNGR